MILHQYNNASYLDTKIREFWLIFKTDILKLSNLSWKEEDYTGKSYNQWKVMQYYSVLSLIILLYLDIQKNKTVHTNWDYYNTKYKLDEKRKCLACECIDLDKILTIFNFPFINCGGGIECMNIENTFIVEGDNCNDTGDDTPPDFSRLTEIDEVRVSENNFIRVIEN